MIRSVFKDLFRSKPKYVTVRPNRQQDFSEKKEIPDGLWVKCDKCSNILYKKDLERSFRSAQSAVSILFCLQPNALSR